MSAKITVINVLYHVPPYDHYPVDAPPPVHWDLPDGRWLGIWGYDIPNQFGDEILKRSSDITYEVWQPDLRADRIYAHVFASGVVHKLFPARLIRKRHGIKSKLEVYSRELIDELRRTVDARTVIHLNAVSGVLNQTILKEFTPVPKVINFHSRISSLPAQQMFKPRRNIFYNLQHMARHFELKRNRKTVYTYNNSCNITYLEKYPNLGIERIFTSIDFDYWVPGDKRQARERFSIKDSTFVFSMASRLNPHKQVDRVIQVLTELDRENNLDFCLLIAGNGEDQYVNYLKKIAEELTGKGKITFVGYLTGDDMRTFYHATDLFISASLSEGGPTTVIKAFACQTLVFCTRSGGVDDYIAEHGGGFLAEWNDYPRWKAIFKQVLLKEKHSGVFNRILAEKYFNRDIAALKYIEIYHKMIASN